MDPIMIAGLIMAGGSALKGILDYFASGKATSAELKALQEGRQIAEKNRAENIAMNKPYSDAGFQMFDQITQGMNNGAFNPDPYQFNDPGMYQQGTFDYQKENIDPEFEFDFEADPGYQFRLNEGLNSIESSAAAKGHQLSGATLKALQQYGQDFASNEYNKVYNRERSNFEGDRVYHGNQEENNRNNAWQQYSFGENMGSRDWQNNRNFLADLSTGNYNRDRDVKNNNLNTLMWGSNVGTQALGNMTNANNNYANTMGTLANQTGDVNAIRDSAGYRSLSNVTGDIVQTVPYLLNQYQDTAKNVGTAGQGGLLMSVGG